jgi:hypothetical protein
MKAIYADKHTPLPAARFQEVIRTTASKGREKAIKVVFEVEQATV